MLECVECLARACSVLGVYRVLVFFFRESVSVRIRGSAFRVCVERERQSRVCRETERERGGGARESEYVCLCVCV
jgi:hypothetical protein